jgi:hypothetical protein
MTSTVGKISGQVLESNLVRQGIDLAFETDLLYLNVNSNRVGINSDSPLRTLYVNDTIAGTNLLIDNPATISDLEFNNSTISADSDIILYATGPSPRITAKTFQVDGIEINSTGISSLRSNEDIDLTPAGSGVINLKNNTEVFGNLHATGNITFDGSMIFGSDSSDSVTFNADIASNIIPDLTDTYSLGSTSNVWSDLYTNFVNGTSYESGGAIVNGIDLSLRAGNIWYVASNGNNSNVGDHPNGPFATIEWALSQATSGDTVYIYPGTYIELFPLVIPEGVTVKGAGLRDVKIIPDTASTHEDVFKLNGQTTVEDLTIADFYYDSLNDKGYAFSFDTGFNVTSRSPYIRNISVITKGSVVSVNDPLGFDQGDAGRGANIDGSIALSTSLEASMLFHSVTMIVPNAYGISMKNGVRVEWLNSFVYYADRGLYAENGTAGFAGLGLKYGAEVRCIGSANVYGNFGAWGDGDSVLMYLINHNFGYIGSGKNTSNDPTTAVAENEVVNQNDSKIYFQSIDHKGDFRVGDLFRIVSSTGDIEFQTSVVSNTSINITDGVNVTYIDADEINTGNIKISGNTIESISGGINFNPFNNLETINNDFNVLGSLTVSSNLDNTGNINFIDNVEIKGKTVYDLISTSNNFDIGSVDKFWKNVYSSQLIFDDINIHGNLISTTISNSDLELRANGTGNIKISDSMVLGQNLIVSGSTNLLNSVVTNTLNVTGNLIINSYTVDEYNNEEILITENYITTTQSNSPLELLGNSLGGVLFEDTLKIQNSSIINNLTSGTEFQRSINFNPYAGQQLAIDSTSALKLPIGNNTNRILSASGEIRYNSSNTTFEGKNSAGTIRLDGLYDLDRNTYITSELNLGTNDDTIRMYTNNIVSANINSSRTQVNSLRVDEIDITGNQIRSFNSNADIELSASGSGFLNIKNNFQLDTDILTNTITDAATQIQSTGTGYVKFADTTAMILPTGTTAERQAGMPVGSTRFNTNLGYLELWNGSSWVVVTGGSVVVDAALMGELSDEYSLIFG